MKTKNLNIFYSVAFVLFLLLPMMFVDLNGGKVSVAENRVLSKRPAMSLMFEHPGSFISQFDSWFSDNIGFRDNLLKGYEIVKLLENFEQTVQYRDGQYVMLKGREGHHYFAGSNGEMIDKFRGKTFLSEAELEGLAGGLDSAKSYLDKKGIPLITMLCVDKEEIYPEYYPESIRRGTGPTQLEIITEYLNANSDADLFNIKNCLLDAKESYPVFDKNGDAANILSHYNEIGAFFAYQELMKHINDYFPEIKSFAVDDVDITYKDVGIYADIPDVTLKKEINYRQLDSGFFDEITLNHLSEIEVYQNRDVSLPTILLLRDSYTGFGTASGSSSFLCKYIPQQFGKTVLIHWRNTANLESYVEYFKPDIVVFESAERELKSFANSISRLAQ